MTQGARLVGRRRRLGRLELGVALDELLGAATREADRETAVVFVAFYAYNGADAVFWMTDLAAEQGIGFDIATARRTAERRRFRTLASNRALRNRRSATDASNEFFRRVRILGIGFIAAGLADFRH